MIALEPGAPFSTYMPSAWPHLDADTVMARLHELRQNAHLIEQGALGLCGEAVFFHHILQRNPVGFFAAAQTLFMQGLCVLGDLVIRPDFDLRLANYPLIDAAREGERTFDTTLAPMPPQADWMVLSALCDSTNIFLDFEGGPGEYVADGAYFFQLRRWYEKSKLYTSVTKDTDTALDHVKTSVIKTPYNHITLCIDVAMIASDSGGHFITLESPLVIDEANDSVSFDYWSWGYEPDTASMTVARFVDNYSGALIAEF